MEENKSAAAALVKQVEAWKDEDEKRSAFIVLIDPETDRINIMGKGEPNQMSKCVYAMMETSRDMALAVYLGASAYAHVNFSKEFIDLANAEITKLCAEYEEKEAGNERD
jgi:hypothetical protein